MRVQDIRNEVVSVQLTSLKRAKFVVNNNLALNLNSNATSHSV